MFIKITFGIIVLNGEPFTRYCIKALYPHAHQIIIAEGACEGARNIARRDGHSSDGTLEILREIKQFNDPDNKITIITAEDEGHPDGFWPGEKHEQSRAYAKKATGNYLWQVDVDEFYHEKDILKIIDLLSKDPSITCISFKQFSFWGEFGYIVDSWYFKRHLPEIYRIFKWGPGYQYASHRPPTVINSNGVDTRKINWLKAEQTKKMGIFIYHYSFVFPKQVKEKASYYKDAEWSQRKKAEWWAENIFMKLENPFRVFSIYWDISWLKKFRGKHPAQILSMIEDLDSGRLNIETRKTEDIEKVLGNPVYRIKRAFFIMLNPFEEIYSGYKKSLSRKIKKLVK